MKLYDIVSHMQENLTKVSDRFSTIQTPVSVSASGDLVSVEMTGHGIADGGVISVSNSSFLNPISSITQETDYVEFVTSSYNDLTNDESKSVYLTSISDPSIDGSYDLISVDHDYDNDIHSFSVASFADVALSDVVLNEFRDLCVNGLYNITLVDDDNFTYQLPEDIGTTLSINASDTKIHTGINITGTTDIDRALKTYEVQLKNVLWAFVEIEDVVTSKDSKITTDAMAEQGDLNFWSIYQNTPFSVYVVVPSDYKLLGRFARDIAEEEKVNLFKILVGAKFDTGFTNSASSSTIPTGDGKYEYKKNHYIHQFQFSQMPEITQDDVYHSGLTSNWKSIEIDILNKNIDNNDVIQSTKINLG
jgi:hypothetical protein